MEVTLRKGAVVCLAHETVFLELIDAQPLVEVVGIVTSG